MPNIEVIANNAVDDAIDEPGVTLENFCDALDKALPSFGDREGMVLRGAGIQARISYLESLKAGKTAGLDDLSELGYYRATLNIDCLGIDADSRAIHRGSYFVFRFAEAKEEMRTSSDLLKLAMRIEDLAEKRRDRSR